MFLWYKGREFFRIFGSRKQIFNYLFKKQLSMKIILNFSKCIMILSLLSLTCTVLSCDEMDIDQGPPISSTRNLMISFKIDTITYGQIPAEHARRILSLDESTSVVTDKSKRSLELMNYSKLEKQAINCFQLLVTPLRRSIISHLRPMWKVAPSIFLLPI